MDYLDQGQADFWPDVVDDWLRDCALADERADQDLFERTFIAQDAHVDAYWKEVIGF